MISLGVAGICFCFFAILGRGLGAFPIWKVARGKSLNCKLRNLWNSAQLCHFWAIKTNYLLHIILPLNWRRTSPCSVLCWLNENPNLWRKKWWLGFFSKLGKNSHKFHWEWGRISFPENTKKSLVWWNCEKTKNLNFFHENVNAIYTITK